MHLDGMRMLPGNTLIFVTLVLARNIAGSIQQKGKNDSRHLLCIHAASTQPKCDKPIVTYNPLAPWRPAVFANQARPAHSTLEDSAPHASKAQPLPNLYHAPVKDVGKRKVGQEHVIRPQALPLLHTVSSIVKPTTQDRSAHTKCCTQ